MGQLYWFLPCCVALTWLYEHSYVNPPLGSRPSKLVYATLMALLICFGGFRGQYNDTWTYRDAYTFIVKPFPAAWETISWDLGENPAFVIVMSWLKTYNVEVHMFIFFFFFWTTLFYMIFIKKYSESLTLAVYFFITNGSYTTNMAAMKQVLATGICLVAVPLLIKKKYIPYIAVVLFSALFHPYSLLYLIAPFMAFRPWSKWTYVLLIFTIVGGYLFQPMVGTIVDITTAIGEKYSVETLTGEGISIPRLFAVWAPVVLSFIYRRVLFDDCSRERQIFANLMMVYACILFVGLFGTALYFGRLSGYFSVMGAVSLSWMLPKISRYNPRDGRFITVCAVVCYWVFFYFANTLETLFTSSYAAVTPWQFFGYIIEWLKQL